MKILFSILLNSFILFAIAYLLSENSDYSIRAGVILGCIECSYFSFEAFKSYFIGGIIIGVINTLVKPVLKILSLPLFFLFFGLTSILVNAIVLYMFEFIINNLLIMDGIGYEINGVLNFVIAVAIFSIFNTLYAIIPFKK